MDADTGARHPERLGGAQSLPAMVLLGVGVGVLAASATDGHIVGAALGAVVAVAGGLLEPRVGSCGCC
jgi:hypothetical protein